ncbi:hypothetical protein [Vibrio nomapromontoriensis]|uniref:hypothetical protein n=1 Tax=Vibrio nomapromontoriensis TaxID=2910246 RepID=UPI003D1496D1
MFSQSILAQLLRMLALLTVTLVAVHHSPTLLELFAGQAINSGCHQQNPTGESHHSHQSTHHHH